MSDMTIDLFAECRYGKLALAKIQPTNPDFRLYYAGWLDDGDQVMKVTGAVFRKAKRGPNKGLLSIKVKGTEQSAYITAKEMEDCEE